MSNSKSYRFSDVAFDSSLTLLEDDTFDPPSNIPKHFISRYWNQKKIMTTTLHCQECPFLILLGIKMIICAVYTSKFGRNPAKKSKKEKGQEPRRSHSFMLSMLDGCKSIKASNTFFCYFETFQLEPDCWRSHSAIRHQQYQAIHQKYYFFNCFSKDFRKLAIPPIATA